MVTQIPEHPREVDVSFTYGTVLEVEVQAIVDVEVLDMKAVQVGPYVANPAAAASLSPQLMLSAGPHMTLTLSEPRCSARRRKLLLVLV